MRVVAIDNDSLNRVVISSTLGKTENSSGEAMYTPSSSSTRPDAMLSATSMSISQAGSGRIIIATMATMPATSTRSL
jgi:hypothetical protein